MPPDTYGSVIAYFRKSDFLLQCFTKRTSLVTSTRQGFTSKRKWVEKSNHIIGNSAFRTRLTFKNHLFRIVAVVVVSGGSSFPRPDAASLSWLAVVRLFAHTLALTMLSGVYTSLKRKLDVVFCACTSSKALSILSCWRKSLNTWTKRCC